MIQHTTLTSDKNPLLRDVRRAIVKGTLTEDGYCIAETFHLLEEAVRSNRPIQVVLAAESVAPAVQAVVRTRPGLRVVVASDTLFHGLVSTETAQGVLALVEPPQWTLDHVLAGKTLAVALDGVQDPGNAGTIIRTAEAFGATGALFLKGSVSPFNPKTLRASAGSLFRLPFVHGLDPREAAARIRERGLDLYAAVARGGRPLPDADLSAPCVVAVGSESRGVSEQVLSHARGLHIPTVGVESLNAAIAAGIILCEASRQRSQPR